MGSWKNIEELEASLTLDELELVVRSAREKEERLMRFYAAFKGVDMDAEKESSEDKLEALKRRANERLGGDSVEVQEFASFGIDFESM